MRDGNYNLATELPRFNNGSPKGDMMTYKSTLYCAGGVGCNLKINDEHLHRKCERCGFTWGEQTADKG